MDMLLRAVEPDDFEMLWRWRNDPDTRRMERSGEIIPRRVYMSWLRANLANPRRSMLLGLRPTSLAPFAFCDIALSAGSRAEMGLNLNPPYRGRGLATPFILQALDQAAAKLGCTEVQADIRVENIRSRRAFARAGFAVIEHEQTGEPGVLRMTRTLPQAGVFLSGDDRRVPALSADH